MMAVGMSLSLGCSCGQKAICMVGILDYDQEVAYSTACQVIHSVVLSFDC